MLVVAGTVLVVLVADAGLLPLAAACFVVGGGLGLIASPTLIAAQSSVAWAERGVVTGNNLFARSLGSALAVAAFGAVANGVLGRPPGAAARRWPTRPTRCSSASPSSRWSWSARSPRCRGGCQGSSDRSSRVCSRSGPTPMLLNGAPLISSSVRT